MRQLREGGIAVRNLTLRYAPTPQPALDNISFTPPRQGMFALVGRNGSGKSSLIRVLLGLQRGFAGDVVVAGCDLHHHDPRSLRSRIGIVDQDTILFAGTIRENVTAGIARADDVRLDRALALAGAHDFIGELPNGLETELQENGRNLSGGQRRASGWQSRVPSSAIPTLCCSMSLPLFLMRKLRSRSKSGLLRARGRTGC